MQNEFYSQLSCGGDQPFIITGSRKISYAEAQRIISGSANRLCRLGVCPGDRVVVLSGNSAEMILLLLACWSIGSVAAPLNVRNPDPVLAEQAAYIKPRLIISSKDFSKVSLGETHSVAIDQIVASSSISGFKLDFYDDATIIFTSGSSGRPKAAVHSFANHYYSALGSNLNIPVNKGDRWLLSLPLYHVGGLAVIFRCVLGGGSIVVPDRGEPLNQSIQKTQSTHISLVAAQLRQLLEEPSNPLAQFKHVLLGGSAIPRGLISQAVDRGVRLHTTYGSTEMASQVTTTSAEDPADKLLTSGRLLKYRELTVAPDGELLVKGETLFKGYWNGERSEPAFDDRGWFHTGDTGFIDEGGYLQVTGRKDNMFISGGENIQPEEIERELLALPEISGAVVVPVPDKKFGQRPAAFVMFSKKKLSAGEIRTQLAKKLPRYKIPDYFLEPPAGLIQEGLKPDRAALKKLAAELLPPLLKD